MGKLPSIKKILREDVKDAPAWINAVIEPLNQFMENVYSALNKNITFSENIASFVKELTYKTTSAYPTVETVEFPNILRTKASGILVLQAVEKSTYTPAAGPVYVPWVEDNGTILISSITGLQADTTYVIRLLVS
jgi:hypothetical protein